MISVEDLEVVERMLREKFGDGDIPYATSHVQRLIQCGYNRAAAIMDALEERGVISAVSATGLRMFLK